MLRIRPSAARLQLPMGQQSFSQKIISVIISLRSTPLTRKTVFLLIAFCVFIVYAGPFFYRHLPSIFSSPFDIDSCLTQHMKQHEKAVGELDAYITAQEVAQDAPPPPLQFVGNGKLGAVVKDSSSLYLIYEELIEETDKNHKKVKYKEQRTYRLPYNPIIRTAHFHDVDSQKSASVINFREGIVERLNCYELQGYSDGCVYVNHTTVAHRSRPNVFLQHIQASIDGSDAKNIKDIEIKRGEFTDLSGFNKVNSGVSGIDLHSGVVELTGGKYLGVAIASQISGGKLQPTVLSQSHVDALTVVFHSDIAKTREGAKSALQLLEKTTSEYARDVLKMSTDDLLKEHRAAWKDILHTGLTVNAAPEPGIPDPSIINATLYYVLSMSDSKLHDTDVPEKERRDLINRLQTPDFCYQGHPTFHGDSLWHRVQTVEDVVRLQQRWVLTLRKHQCQSLVSEGAEGILQAMLLSFGGLKFTENDLRLGTDPDVLHNDIAFHSLIYRNDTLDIAIRRQPNSDTPVIMVALREPSKIPLYACEAGCMLDAVELSPIPHALPVYVTDPITSILYISHDKKHLSDLRDTLHVKKIVDHAEHMEFIRNRTGLPTIFWVGIGSLIIFFHLFLIRLICNEYKATMSGNSSYLTGVSVGNMKSSSRYNSRGRLAS